MQSSNFINELRASDLFNFDESNLVFSVNGSYKVLNLSFIAQGIRFTCRVVHDDYANRWMEVQFSKNNQVFYGRKWRGDTLIPIKEESVGEILPSELEAVIDDFVECVEDNQIKLDIIKAVYGSHICHVHITTYDHGNDQYKGLPNVWQARRSPWEPDWALRNEIYPHIKISCIGKSKCSLII